MRAALPDYLKPVVTSAYLTDWRKGEILGLKWNQVDLEAGLIRIDPGITKGGEGRLLPLHGELREVIEAQ